MKISTLLLLLLYFNLSSSQKLAENKIDEFTKDSVKRTTWETVMEKNGMFLYARASKLKGVEFLDIKVMLSGGVFSIREGDKLMLKLSSDTIVSLENLKYQISCRGCGAKGIVGSGSQGVMTTYVIKFESDHTLLKTFPIKKVRLYTSDGYIEHEVTDKRSDILQKLVTLIE